MNLLEEAVTKGLERAFEQHRLVFWYDDGGQWQEFCHERLDLPGVRLCEIEPEKNEFALMYKLTEESPNEQFLVYCPAARPQLDEDWLLGLRLQNFTFEANKAALAAQELELDDSFRPLIQKYADFFNAGDRVDALKTWIGKVRLTEKGLQYRMITSRLGKNPESAAPVRFSADDLFLKLITRQIEGKELPKLFGLEPFLWGQAQAIYGYREDEPSVESFMRALLINEYRETVGEGGTLTQDAKVLLGKWKLNDPDGLRTFSEENESLLGIPGDAGGKDLETLVPEVYFKAVDRCVIEHLAQQIGHREISDSQASDYIQRRRQSLWVMNGGEYRNDYDALSFAAKFFEAIEGIAFKAETAEEVLERYCTGAQWYMVDQLYRNFFAAAGQTVLSALEPLKHTVEAAYRSKFMDPLTQLWQPLMDRKGVYSFGNADQRKFFERHVRPLASGKKKVCVIISDALRYEAGAELAERLKSQNRYEAECSFMAAQAPTVTAVGMAALLPHKELQVSVKNQSLQVAADGMNCAGIENRANILKATGLSCCAFTADEFSHFDKEEARQKIKGCDVVYIYHNVIDKLGDDSVSELKLPKAVEDAVDDLMMLIRRLTNANITTMLVTGDHGFIYQEDELDPSLVLNIDTDSWSLKKHRFGVAQGLKELDGIRAFDKTELGLEGDETFLFARGLSRIPPKKGTRFVHGGLSIQEIAIPVVFVRKKRADTVSPVSVTLMSGGGDKYISTNVKKFKLYQDEAVGAEMLPRKLTCGIYAQDGTLLTDTVTIEFNSSSDSIQDRERLVTLHFSSLAEKYNNCDVVLRIIDDNSVTDYIAQRYRLKRSFGGDFDDLG